MMGVQVEGRTNDKFRKAYIHFVEFRFFVDIKNKKDSAQHRISYCVSC